MNTTKRRLPLLATALAGVTGLVLTIATIATADKPALPAGLPYPPPFPTGSSGPVADQAKPTVKPEDLPIIKELRGRAQSLREQLTTVAANQAKATDPVQRDSLAETLRSMNLAIQNLEKEADDIIYRQYHPPTQAERDAAAKMLADWKAEGESDRARGQLFEYAKERASSRPSGNGFIPANPAEMGAFYNEWHQKTSRFLATSLWIKDLPIGHSLQLVAGSVAQVGADGQWPRIPAQYDRSQGAVLLYGIERPIGSGPETLFRTPTRSGPVRVVDADGDIVELVAEDGARFFFDTSMAAFVAR